MPEFFYLLINYPVLIAAPIIFYAALALWSHSRTAWVATAAWVVYLGYELGMNAGVFCSGDGCLRRSPLYFGYPLLAFLSAVALIQVYVHVRDNSIKARLGRGIHQPGTLAASSSSDQVSTVALAWDAFMRALAETSELRRSGANVGTVAELLRHAHHWLILHGRYVCKARRPECWRCVTAAWCLYRDKTPAKKLEKSDAPVVRRVGPRPPATIANKTAAGATGRRNRKPRAAGKLI